MLCVYWVLLFRHQWHDHGDRRTVLWIDSFRKYYLSSQSFIIKKKEMILTFFMASETTFKVFENTPLHYFLCRELRVIVDQE